jgi:hypothetical protein
MENEFNYLLDATEEQLTNLVNNKVILMQGQIDLGEQAIKMVGKFYDFAQDDNVVSKLKEKIEKEKIDIALKYTGFYQFNPFFIFSKRAKELKRNQAAYAAILKIAEHINNTKKTLGLILQAKDLLDKLNKPEDETLD